MRRPMYLTFISCSLSVAGPQLVYRCPATCSAIDRWVGALFHSSDLEPVKVELVL